MQSLVPLSLLAVVPVSAQEPAAAPPNRVAYVDAFPGQERFERPVWLDHHPSDPDHYWIVEQQGVVLRVPRAGESGSRQQVLDWSERCLHPGNGGHNEEGLLGFAFDPRFGDGRPHVWLYYSHEKSRRGRDVDRESVISRFTVREGDDGPSIDPDSELVVMRIDQPWGNHNGGTLVFGPDGMLYVALGDGGAADDRGRNGQNLATLLATILRIDVRTASAAEPYAVPEDNPFVGRDDARPEIFAWGLRNPWRMSFDRKTGELWCADVGQNLWEEVDRIVAGGNYGWPLFEATHPFPPGAEREARADLIPPVAEYSHKEGLSVTGGHVYRGSKLPELDGHYVYGDFVTRRMWAVLEDREGAEHRVVELPLAPAPIASFAEDEDGEHLLLCFDGRIYRMVPAERDG